MPVEDAVDTAAGHRKLAGHKHWAGRAPHVWLVPEYGTAGCPSKRESDTKDDVRANPGIRSPSAGELADGRPAGRLRHSASWREILYPRRRCSSGGEADALGLKTGNSPGSWASAEEGTIAVGGYHRWMSPAQPS